MVRRDKTNLPPARFLEPPGTVREPSVLPPLGVKHIPQPRGSQSSTDGGTNTAERAVHRASKKGYTAGRLPVYEPKIRTPATTKAWCDSVRASNQLMNWRSYLDKPNANLPSVPARPPSGWSTEYGRVFSPSRRTPIQTPTRRIVGYTPWADAKKDFNESFDKITTVKGRVANEDIIRPFMSQLGGRVGRTSEVGLNSTIRPLADGRMPIKFAGKDTAESQAWDGTMSFDNVYSEKHVLKDTASSVVLAG